MEIINGPIATPGDRIIYQVTLASGAIVTSPAGFPADALEILTEGTLYPFAVEPHDRSVAVGFRPAS